MRRIVRQMGGNVALAVGAERFIRRRPAQEIGYDMGAALAAGLADGLRDAVLQHVAPETEVPR